MSTTTETTPAAQKVATTPMRLEVTAVPVADVDRAKEFYARMGWREDIDFKPTPDTRGVQFTPPGSPASVQFGENTTRMAPGSVDGLILVVEDIEAARDDLISRGIDVGPIGHLDLEKGPAPGRHPDGLSYFTRAPFEDPDGNRWELQEVTERLPGRVQAVDVGSLAELLHETAEHHGAFEEASPPHDWWDWYAAYADARQSGSSPDEADAAADRYMAEVKGVVASR